mgnify:CR=1 FL=1
MSGLRIGFFGDGSWAVKSLECLLAQAEVAFVCLRHGSPDMALGQVATNFGIPIIDLADVNEARSLETLRKFGCDLFLSVSFDQILRPSMFSLPGLGTINCHAGMLPFYRGRSVLNWAIINDESSVGITVHYVDDGIDTGDIVLQRFIEVTDDDDYRTLLARGSDACAEAVCKAVGLISSGRANPIEQASIDPVGSYFTRRLPGDERIVWGSSSREVFNLVRAVTPPGPGAVTWIDDEEWRILKVRIPDAVRPWNMVAGAVIPSPPEVFRVKTTDTFVDVLEWEGPRRPRVGDRFSS